MQPDCVAIKHKALLDAFLLIENPQERLAAILQRSRKIPAPAPEHCTDTTRVEGCVSRVWLRATLEGDVCAFELRAESQLVAALADLVCEPFHGAPPAGILAWSGDLLLELGITPQLTPTRRTGLQQLLKRIHCLAASHVV